MENYTYPNAAREELKEFLPNDYLTVLEIGCGTGGFRQSLKNDIEIWGIEPNEFAAKEAENKGYKVLIGFYDDVEKNCPNHYFDLIICNDVIEHMVDHEKFLIDIKKQMKKNACIVGSIPNIRHYPILIKLIFKKDWQYTEEGILDKTHLRFFTEKSLKRTFDNCGYGIENFKGINPTGQYWFTLKSTIKYIFIHCTFGFFKDTQYLQFAFRIKQN